jgi:hypothetical protein
MEEFSSNPTTSALLNQGGVKCALEITFIAQRLFKEISKPA